MPDLDKKLQEFKDAKRDKSMREGDALIKFRRRLRKAANSAQAYYEASGRTVEAANRTQPTHEAYSAAMGAYHDDMATRLANRLAYVLGQLYNKTTNVTEQYQLIAEAENLTDGHWDGAVTTNPPESWGADISATARHTPDPTGELRAALQKAAALAMAYQNADNENSLEHDVAHLARVAYRAFLDNEEEA
jgi:hypothetical protein